MRAALADPDLPARLTANNGRYRAEALFTQKMREELLRDLSESL